MIERHDEDDDGNAIEPLWHVICDGDREGRPCGATLGNGYKLELFALFVATQHGWRMRRVRKFTGSTTELLCSRCAPRREPWEGEP